MEASFPKVVYEVNLNTHIIHKLSMTSSSSWVWIFKTGILWVRKVKSYQSPNWAFCLVELYPRNIETHKKSVLQASQTLEKVVLKGWNSFLHPFFSSLEEEEELTSCSDGRVLNSLCPGKRSHNQKHASRAESITFYFVRAERSLHWSILCCQ